MTKKITRTQLEDDFLEVFYVYDALQREIFEKRLKAQEMSKKLEDLMAKIQEEKGKDNGTISEKK